MEINGYEIYVTDQELPHLSTSWSSVTVNDNSYSFQRNSDTSRIFSISGYIQRDTESETYSEAKGLNDSIIDTPSGTYTDGFGDTYEVLVESCVIKPVAGSPRKWSVNMSFRMIS